MSSHRTYSSSAPKYDTQRPGRTYASPTPESYHGRQFVNAGAQEQYWNSRGSTEVWDPSKPLSSVAARPDTYGLAHSYHESTMEHEYSDPYKKRPNPYTARTKADYDVYKRPSEGHGGIAEEVRRYKDTPVGRKTSPHDYHRDNLIKGKNLAKEGRDMANIAAQSRLGFDHKYPQAYESRDAIIRHVTQANSQKRSAAKFRDDGAHLDRKLDTWGRQMDRRGRR